MEIFSEGDKLAPPNTHYHAVQFYEDDSSLAGTVAHFLAEGFSVGHPGLVIATPAHAGTISRALASRGLQVGPLQTSGELLFCNAHKVLASFLVADQPNPVLFKIRLGEVIEHVYGGRQRGPIRAYGEMVDLLWQDGNCDAAIKLETLWNQLSTVYEFSLLCGYAVGHFHEETRDRRYQDVCDLHSHVIPPGN